RTRLGAREHAGGGGAATAESLASGRRRDRAGSAGGTRVGAAPARVRGGACPGGEPGRRSGCARQGPNALHASEVSGGDRRKDLAGQSGAHCCQRPAGGPRRQASAELTKRRHVGCTELCLVTPPGQLSSSTTMPERSRVTNSGKKEVRQFRQI